ncbi:MAG: GAF domain-containing protein, partial [Elusimicrobia bacterium]|nr:GAF domain-containing protein [Elusimicrobiota bacterium]
MLGLFHYQILCEVLRDVHLVRGRQAIAQFVLNKVAQALDSEGGTIFLMDQENLLCPMAAYGAPKATLQEQKYPVGRGVAGWVAAHKEPVKIADAKSDPRFLSAVDLRTGFDTRSIVAAPILFGAKVEGVIEFLNKRKGEFSDADLELIALLGREIGAAIEKTVLEEHVRKATALQWAVGNLHAGVVIADPHHKVIMANSRAQQILSTESFQINEGDNLDNLDASWPELAYSVKKVMETTLPISQQETGIYP